MKKIFLMAMLFSAVQVKAAPQEVIISEKEVILNVDISSKNLKWSRADYSEPVVKILVPELADVTILDHRNNGEGAPCMASYEARSPEEVIKNNPAIEQIPMRIVLKKILIKDLEKQTCEVFLKEDINAQIRWFDFVHTKQIHVGTRHIDDCR